MKRALWLLRRRGPALALGVGAALLVLGLVLHQLAVQPLATRVQALETQRMPARESMLDRAGDVLARSDSPRTQLTAFYGHFEGEASLTARLARLHTIASGLKLELPRADYKLASAPERRLARYQMVLPVRGRYPVIRRFIGEALREMPTLALESIQFQRKEVGDGTVDALITFVFFVTPS